MFLNPFLDCKMAPRVTKTCWRVKTRSEGCDLCYKHWPTASVVQEIRFRNTGSCTVVPGVFRVSTSLFPAVHAIAHLETQSSKIKAHEAAKLHLQGALKPCASVLGETASCQLNNLSKTRWPGSTAFDSESLWRARTRFRIGGKSVRAGEGWELLCSSCMRA